MKLSVIICCYNSSQRLLPTLESLANQSYTGEWEIVLVDNNSSDGTKTIAEEIWKTFESITFFKTIHESRAGLSSARKAGVIEAVGELILFCDDDNHLDSSYIANLVRIMDSDKEIGALCGFNEPIFESQPSELVKTHITAYACGHYNLSSCYLNAKITPWGAGLVMRRSFLINLYNNHFESLLSDRKGNELSSGGDTEFCYILRLLGYKWKYDTDLKLKHAIPKERLNDDYLRKIYFGFGKANAVIEWYYGGGDINRLNENVKWRNAYLSQKYLFVTKNNKIPNFEAEYQKGYMNQLWSDRKYFLKKRIGVKQLLSHFNAD